VDPAAKSNAKPRWTTAKKTAKAKQARLARAQEGKPAGGKAKPHSGGKPKSKTGDKPKGKHAQSRHPQGGNAAPRRARGMK
jgi:hypothetical protein